MKLVSKLNNGIVDVSPEFAKVLLAKKSEWAKLTDHLAALEADKAKEASA